MFTLLERSFDSKQSPKSKLNFLEASQANSDYFGQADVTPKIVATKVKSLLQSHKTSHDALLLLDCYLSTFPASVVQAEALAWTRSIIHLLAGKRPRGSRQAGWRLLCRLLPLLPEQLSRDAAGLMPVLLERLLAQLSSPTEREPEEGALKCLLVCMKDYGRLMGSVQDALEKTLLRLLVSWNSQPVQELVCECVALLPGCRRAGGSSGSSKGGAPSEAWSRQLGCLLATVHAALDSLFQDLHVGKGRPRAEKAVPLDVPNSPEESHQASLLCWRRIMSLMRTISLMLQGSSVHLPVAVPVEDVLELVQRVLGAHLPVKSSGATAHANIVAAILPSIQYEAVQLLCQLVRSCRQLLVPHAATIVSLIEETVLHTTQELSNDTRRLRQACYAALSLWLQTVRSRLGLGSLVEKLVPHLLCDIEPIGASTMQLASRNGSSAPRKDRNKVDDNFNLELSAQLCEHALKALQSLVYTFGATMKPEAVQEVQRNVVTLLLRLQQPGAPLPQPYRSPRCRRALYTLLLSLATSSGGPPPLHCCARLFSMGLRDTCCEVAELCTQALSCLSLHPQGAAPTGTRAPLRCHRAKWALVDGTCQTVAPPLASVACQAQLQPPPAPPVVAAPQPPLKRKAAAAAMHFRVKRITTLEPAYRGGNQEPELLSDEDGHDYMEFQEEYEEADIEKLQAAESVQARHPPINGQGRQAFHERHIVLGSGAGRGPTGASGSAKLVPVAEDSSEDEECSEEEYDEEEDEGDYVESNGEVCIEPIELESDEVDAPAEPAESDGAPEAVVDTSHEEDQEVGADSDAALSTTATIATEPSVTALNETSEVNIIAEDDHAKEEEEVGKEEGVENEEEIEKEEKPEETEENQQAPLPPAVEQAKTDLQEGPCAGAEDVGVSDVVEEVVAVVVENHTDEKCEDEQPACEEVEDAPTAKPSADTTATEPTPVDSSKEQEPNVAEMLQDFVDCDPDE